MEGKLARERKKEKGSNQNQSPSQKFEIVVTLKTAVKSIGRGRDSSRRSGRNTRERMPWLSWFKRVSFILFSSFEGFSHSTFCVSTSNHNLHLKQSPKEPDYETVLSSLSASIKDRESLLLSINKRERSANALFITYGLGAWVVYFTLWYFNVILGRNGNGADYVIGWAITLGGPVA